jgi:hypothetical protein
MYKFVQYHHVFVGDAPRRSLRKHYKMPTENPASIPILKKNINF